MSLRALLALAAVDLKRQLRQRETVLWLLVMPLPFMLFFGFAVRGGTPTKPTVIVVAPQPDDAAGSLAAALADADFDATVTPSPPQEPARLMVTMPPTAGALLASGGAGTITVRSPDGSAQGRRLEVEVRKWLWGARGALLTARLRGNTPDVSALAEPPAGPAITVEASDWGVYRPVPAGFKQSVPGNMIMFTLMAVLLTGSVRLLDDRQAGRLRRVLSFPVPPAAVVAAQLVSLTVTGLAEVVFLVVVSTLVFHRDLGGHLGVVLAVLALLVLATAGIGALFGAVLRNHTQAVAVGLFTTLGLAALGGCWWPLEVVPRSLAHVALALPSGQAMHALVRALVWGDSPTQLWGTALYLATFAVVTATAAALVLRRRID